MVESSSELYVEGLLLLGGALIAAPLFKRIGLGTILGYLAAGVVIGPVLRLILDGEEILHFAELGVVLLLFLIGLELKPRQLKQMRMDIFGLGASQVLVSGLLLGLMAYFLARQGLAASIIIGLGLALSSTAFALQLLDEYGDLNTGYGQKSFSILLFQDLAIVPLLALVSILAPFSSDDGGSVLTDTGIAIGAIAALLLVGRYLLNPLFQIIANTGAHEAMIAAALFVVLAAATLMELAGLSMALGAFLAGVLLAESRYRHELRADIEPFRGILLGLFFMAVGMSLDLGVLGENWLLIAVAVPAIMLSKSIVLYWLTRAFGSPHNDSARVSGLLPQGGEFGFVIFTAAASQGIFSSEMSSLLVAIVTLTMALTPVVAAVSRRLMRKAEREQMDETFEGAGSDVLMVGFSRFGQIAAQVLLAGGSDVTIIDYSADRIRAASKFGFRIYFGDGTRKEVLIAAGIARARVVAVCTQKKEATDQVVDLIQAEFPNTKLYVRAYDRAHTLSLRDRGVSYELRETLESGLKFGRKTLEAIGAAEDRARDVEDLIRRLDEERLEMQAVDGFHAGSEKVLTKPLTPEPLIRPANREDASGRNRTDAYDDPSVTERETKEDATASPTGLN
ncbi:monovalent cation:proton antiporter-2 (CPA2) family protein [Pseudohoeflea coraliihabitans]|uniref:Monovalent cation:proton antiporter-2 (CPA2) family protein n=1 Tax=Pseudohoeflea coraliihabitans TaxID=2860393 RepID=A0ABS6WPU7_9HYPH|nr:monovalent cation:proton antiporter-2 (CPA2) family protein [Pseudohoeflea sp. DP4N28-3]MBW3097094.1 monovalent cation:proton antiporter-2 (CPA2) family protein [Pseudohoeflea sp. DP4N28-3]